MLALDVPSLSELLSRQPDAQTGEEWLKFSCPFSGICSDKPFGKSHRSLGVNQISLGFKCHRCGAHGKLRSEFSSGQFGQSECLRLGLSEPKPRPTQNWKEKYADQLQRLQPIQDTPGEDYLNLRGIPTRLCVESRVRYSRNFLGRPAVVFPIRDFDGKLCAVQGRFIDDPMGVCDHKCKTIGKPSLGVFSTPLSFESKWFCICEAPIDALSLAVMGRPAVATLGVSNLPGWIVTQSRHRNTVLCLDSDEAGETACAEWSQRLKSVCQNVSRAYPPNNHKDWNEFIMNSK